MLKSHYDLNHIKALQCPSMYFITPLIPFSVLQVATFRMLHRQNCLFFLPFNIACTYTTKLYNNLLHLITVTILDYLHKPLGHLLHDLYFIPKTA
jgi:hypothetical protein